MSCMKRGDEIYLRILWKYLEKKIKIPWDLVKFFLMFFPLVGPAVFFYSVRWMFILIEEVLW